MTEHLTDQDLVLAIDGELGAQATAQVEEHIRACWSCRARKAELEGAIAGFVEHFRNNQLHPIPPLEGPRALLKARLGQLAAQEQRAWRRVMRGVNVRRVAGVTAAILFVALGLDVLTIRWPISVVALAAPDPALTPGSVIFKPREQLCQEALPKNKDVPAQLRKRVLDEYGYAQAPADAFEVDYLITPALGGSDDIHNLWPHAYRNTVWTAKVKDSLEDRLHELVCEGRLDLPTAQREISTNWIAAYKKYFHTESPLPESQR